MQHKSYPSTENNRTKEKNQEIRYSGSRERKQNEHSTNSINLIQQIGRLVYYQET
ncbi:hypothetical protein Nepgr_015037 [Nepenthes gracilis]|uniref:Uncharacterized protein n=1 Tax=Nepenthes gracilis TaxID=150966 RepID=A0AAD3SMX9_NEPGR|nr:hypothetical protein Nepgr_015037 [Nepenthes gracilis]